MYFWKYKELALALRNNEVTAKQYRIYMIVFWIQALLVLPALVAQPLPYVPAIAVWVAITYVVNKRGDGKDYFKRLVCLDLPITIKAFVVCTIAMIPLIIIAAETSGQPTMPLWLEKTIVVVSLTYYLTLFVKGFSIVAGKKE